MRTQSMVRDQGATMRIAAAAVLVVALAILMASCGGGSDDPPAAGGGGGGVSGAASGGASTTLQSLPAEATASYASFLGWMRGLARGSDDTAQPFSLGAGTLPADDAAQPAAL